MNGVPEGTVPDFVCFLFLVLNRTSVLDHSHVPNHIAPNHIAHVPNHIVDIKLKFCK